MHSLCFIKLPLSQYTRLLCPLPFCTYILLRRRVIEQLGGHHAASQGRPTRVTFTFKGYKDLCRSLDIEGCGHISKQCNTTLTDLQRGTLDAEGLTPPSIHFYSKLRISQTQGTKNQCPPEVNIAISFIQEESNLGVQLLLCNRNSSNFLEGGTLVAVIASTHSK